MRDYKSILTVEGQSDLLVQAMEECGELIQACSKLYRFNWAQFRPPISEEQVRYNIREEIADVGVMLEILALMFFDSSDELYSCMNQKVSRWKKRLGIPEE